jgi:hypothetical protein
MPTLFLLLSLAAALGTVQAQAKPDFSGTWKVNLSKSDFGSGPAPESRTDKISYEDPNLKDTITQSLRGRETTYDMNYATDGKETTNTVRGTEVKSIARWQGDELVVDTKGSIGGRPLTFNDRWSLASDGKTLTLQRHLVSPMGETDQKIVFDKQ